MSYSQQVSFKNWQFYVFFASTIFAAGGAWHRLEGLAESQAEFSREVKTGIQQRERMQESIFRLQEQLKALEQRMEAKKIVAMLSDSDPIATIKLPARK